EAPRITDAAHEERLHVQRAELLTDDHFGGAAADIDHQASVGGRRQFVRDAGEDQPRLFLAGNDLDGKAQCVFEPGHDFLGIGGDAQRVGGDRAYAVRVKALDALAEALERDDGAFDRLFIQHVVRPQAGRQPHVFLEPVDRVDLGGAVVLHHAPDGKPEAVRTEV